MAAKKKAPSKTSSGQSKAKVAPVSPKAPAAKATPAAAAKAKPAAAKKAPATRATPAAAAKAKPAAAKKAPAAKAAAPKAKPPAAAKAVAPAPSGLLPVGTKAPAFEAFDQSGTLVTSASLRGRPYVLYFYPKDDTPGCTREACGFRDGYAAFTERGVVVLGVSPDKPESHASFAQKYELPFPLLSDTEKKLAIAFGAWALKTNYGRQYYGVVRSTFLVGRDGKIAHVWNNVKVDGHSESVLARVGASA